mgnify:CR=1 FL=1
MVWILAIIGVIVAVAGIAYAVYRFVKPDYLEEFEESLEQEEYREYSEESILDIASRLKDGDLKDEKTIIKNISLTCRTDSEENYDELSVIV